MKSLLPFIPIIFALIKWMLRLFQDSMVEPTQTHEPNASDQQEPLVIMQSATQRKDNYTMHSSQVGKRSINTQLITDKPQKRQLIKSIQQKNKQAKKTNQKSLLEKKLNQYNHLHQSIIMHELLTPQHFKR